ncbi:MAG: hypothetical protein N3E45_00955 [Oscillatoriaceae bacterium SKW80]|nr:hypothetical protein [Oscillatoriaceae bacterium SKYG93]MCX8119398.1 hypothetical protein [Oscillatoriaceae bacterium SKW80]MDW8454865.1 hypothetical protein [Oscillatoriaceae cyanobacterium SKYGB_i_bin93]HIK28356.1 hypothetical protein [Oscillatoriaceae cyanobacterium M7585_C2015_266]
MERRITDCEGTQNWSSLAIAARTALVLPKHESVWFLTRKLEAIMHPSFFVGSILSAFRF